MKGLLLKDFYVITKQLTIFLFAIPMIVLVGGNAISTLAILISGVLPMTAIAYDEHSKWNELAIMMPYSKKEIIISKYLLGYICMFATVVLIFIGQFFRNIFLKEKLDSIDGIVIGVFITLVFIAVNNLVQLKFGSEKGRFVYIALICCMAAAGSILKNIDSNILMKFQNLPLLFLLFTAIILNFISIIISLQINIKEK